MKILFGTCLGVLLVAWVMKRELGKDNPYKKYGFFECLEDLIIKIYDNIKEKIEEIKIKLDELETKIDN